MPGCPSWSNANAITRWLLFGGVALSEGRARHGAWTRRNRAGGWLIGQMNAIPVSDPLYGTGKVWPDGRFVHANRVWITKPKAESKFEWDQFKLLATIPEDTAFQRMDVLGCPLLKT